MYDKSIYLEQGNSFIRVLEVARKQNTPGPGTTAKSQQSRLVGWHHRTDELVGCRESKLGDTLGTLGSRKVQPRGCLVARLDQVND